MTTDEIVEKAAEYKHGGYNCAQSVVKALAEAAGLDAEAPVQLAAGFGSGMGTMEATCGALVGANMIAGLRTEGKGTVMKSKELHRRFTERCGASLCKDLKGRDTGVVLCSCDDCVRNAVRALEETFSE